MAMKPSRFARPRAAPATFSFTSTGGLPSGPAATRVPKAVAAPTAVRAVPVVVVLLGDELESESVAVAQTGCPGA